MLGAHPTLALVFTIYSERQVDGYFEPEYTFRGYIKSQLKISILRQRFYRRQVGCHDSGEGTKHVIKIPNWENKTKQKKPTQSESPFTVILSVAA